MTSAATSVLSQPLLDRCRERAPGYDRDNKFRQEDFDELKAAGYLQMAVPKEFGAGRFHPANAALSREVVGKLAMGISPDDTPHWG